METNPSSDTGIHSAVPHRYLLAYLIAIKSFLQYYPDITVFVHDDGSLTAEDKDLIRAHEKRRIIIVDTDTLFLKKPTAIIDWAAKGGSPWYHRVHQGKMKVSVGVFEGLTQLQDVHIQALITQDLGSINEELGRNYQFMPGFNSGFIGYENGTVNFEELRKLFLVLHARFSDRIFRWGAEQYSALSIIAR